MLLTLTVGTAHKLKASYGESYARSFSQGYNLERGYQTKNQGGQHNIINGSMPAMFAIKLTANEYLVRGR